MVNSICDVISQLKDRTCDRALTLSDSSGLIDMNLLTNNEIKILIWKKVNNNLEYLKRTLMSALLVYMIVPKGFDKKVKILKKLTEETLEIYFVGSLPSTSFFGLDRLPYTIQNCVSKGVSGRFLTIL